MLINMMSKMNLMRRCAMALLLLLPAFAHAQAPAGEAEAELLFREVRVLDTARGTLGAPTDVLVRGNRIAAIGDGARPTASARVIEGHGRTLMPGLIDVHWHSTFTALSQADLLAPDASPEKLAATVATESARTLLRGFTSVRDAGGPIFELKAAIDAGKMPGPRIWPSGAFVSQTSGHGDLRQPHERSRRFFGKPSMAEEMGATFIADGRDEVLTAVRENLRMGASQIKLMAGGGTSSAYDPVDVTQYTFDEMRAAVEAAEDWGTYVTVHAYTVRAVRRAIEAGVKCIEHGQLLDEDTLKLMAERGIWLSTQTLRASTEDMDPLRREKRKPVIEGQARTIAAAKRSGVRMAWGTDFLFDPALNVEQNAYILLLREWFTPAEILKMVTHDNAELLALSGLRSPYQGRLGVVEAGALADLLLVEGNPLTDLEVVADPERNFVVIVKDGRIVKRADGT
ncbi:MAG: amidohydrolase family protein [Pseudoxanthomonas sp.]|nr:amidohydrolase family protein [Pseudoxanthomonas sp.]MBP8741182.1 amidohydrolase family protein [Pseudoxanthomonas sp.]MBP9534383.1 amidohydrolase family protein [Pseudoxanthomonas sp.]MBP9644865.1 amidohydrolase family protein [Pseudoxanthomonas sp.]